MADVPRSQERAAVNVPAELVSETERLWIREWNQADADRVLDIQSRWEVVRWLDDDADVMVDLDQARERIARWRSIPVREGTPCGHWASRSSTPVSSSAPCSSFRCRP
jgi:hypothetical protein